MSIIDQTPYKLRDWFYTPLINEIFKYLSGNPNAIHLLDKNQDKIDWVRLSGNPNAIHLLEKNQDKIDWVRL